MDTSWNFPGSWQLYVAYPYLIALTFVLPAAAGARRWRAARREALKGHCRSCGYDLRTSPDRCPECGTVPSAGT